MTFTLGTFSFEGTPMPKKTQNSVPVHEIAGSNSAYVQFTGRNNRAYEFSALLSTADKDTLAAMADAAEVVTFSDTVTGVSGVDVMIESCIPVEVAPGAWQVSMSLIGVPI